MSRYYDKDQLKNKLEVNQIYDLLELWGGEPEYIEGGLLSQTICHNLPGEGSRKLYWYENTKLCHCYTGCVDPSFDIFDLAIKVAKIQNNLDWELYDAMDYIASYFGLQGQEKQEEKEEKSRDWEIFERHSKITRTNNLALPQLPEYNPVILTRFSYPRIASWEQEGILPEVARRNLIGYYPGGEKIVIPHYDINGRLIGVRGRSLSLDEADRYGKYRPLTIGKQTYNHPLSMNLYHLHVSKENIAKIKTAIVFESEKATLMYESYYGRENDISISCCGSNLSKYHVELLRQLGVRELIIAFDKDYEEIGDEIFKRAKNKLIHMGVKYGNMMKITVVFDRENILPIHSSPIDQGPEVFEKLLKERFIP